MAKEKKTDNKPNTNGFPLNGGFPQWITDKKCGTCKNSLNFSNYKEIGFFSNGEFSGKLFVRYSCSNCGNEATIKFGNDEEFTLERLCTLVIQHSNLLSSSDKMGWKNKYIDP